MTTSDAAGALTSSGREPPVDAQNDDAMLRFVRLRPPGYRLPVHVLCEAGRFVEDDPWPGAEQLLVRGGRLQAAHSRDRLRREYYTDRAGQLAEAPVLMLDLVRTRRALTRPHTAWSGMTRGSLVELDDLLWMPLPRWGPGGGKHGPRRGRVPRPVPVRLGRASGATRVRAAG